MSDLIARVIVQANNCHFSESDKKMYTNNKREIQNVDPKNL